LAIVSGRLDQVAEKYILNLMEINQTPVDHEHATVTLKVLLLIFAIVLVGALGYLVWTQNTVPDTADSSTTTAKTTTFPLTDWKTYTSTNPAYSFSYPADAVLNPSYQETNNSPLGLVVNSQTTKVSSFTPAPYWEHGEQTKAGLENERLAIQKNNPSVASSTSYSWLQSSYEIIRSGNLKGIGFVDLAWDNVCIFRTTFALKTHYYIGQNNDDLVEILLQDNRLEQIANANIKYFETTNDFCPGLPAWKDNGQQQFYDDLVAGKTDPLTQTWYKTFQEIAASFKAQ